MNIKIKYECSECSSSNCEHFTDQLTGNSGTRCKSCGHTREKEKANFIINRSYNDMGNTQKF